MEITVRQCDFVEVTFKEGACNTGNNSDTFTFDITAEGQPCLVNGEEMEKFSITIVGTAELSEFFGAMNIIQKAIKGE